MSLFWNYVFPVVSLTIYFNAYQPRLLTNSQNCIVGIIGYAPAFNKILNFGEVGNTDDDQLYYTRIYLKHRVGESILSLRVLHENYQSWRSVFVLREVYRSFLLLSQLTVMFQIFHNVMEAELDHNQLLRLNLIFVNNQMKQVCTMKFMILNPGLFKLIKFCFCL